MFVWRAKYNKLYNEYLDEYMKRTNLEKTVKRMKATHTPKVEYLEKQLKQSKRNDTPRDKKTGRFIKRK